MSSPIHHPKDLDAVLMYAPPWAREQGPQKPFRPSSALGRGKERRKPKPIALSSYEYSGDRDMARLQRQLALNPDKIPEPPTETVRSLLPVMFRFCAVASVVASVVWVLISLPGVRLVRSEAARIAASAPVHVAAASMPAPAPVEQRKSDPLRTETGADRLIQHGLALATPQPPAAEPQAAIAVPSPAAKWPAIAPPPAVAPPPTALHPVETVSVAMPQPNPPQPGADRAAAEKSAVQVDSEEMATLVKRGKEALIDGDFASARLLLRRAADGGSADAAFALATTFDPVVLRRLSAVGVEADAAMARDWYAKAAALGSTAKPPVN